MVNTVRSTVRNNGAIIPQYCSDKATQSLAGFRLLAGTTLCLLSHRATGLHILVLFCPVSPQVRLLLTLSYSNNYQSRVVPIATGFCAGRYCWESSKENNQQLCYIMKICVRA